MDSSGGRLNTSASISQHQIFSYYNSLSNLVSNDNKNEEPNSGLFDFHNEIESSNHFLTPFFSSSSLISTHPNQFLDSPSFLFNSNIISSPTLGNYFGYDFEEGKTNVSDLNSRSRTSPATISRNKMVDSMKSQVLDWNDKSQPKQFDFSKEISKIKPEPKSIESPHKECKFYPVHASNNQSKFEDGYKWRKYGQKQVKGSKKPRSYFKCSYPNCPTKKKVEKDLNGHITEIIYKGKHNHPMPQQKKTSLSNSFQNTIFDNHNSIHKNRFDSSSQNSFVSFGEDGYDQDSSISKSGNEQENEADMRGAKRWKTDEADSETVYCVGRKVAQEPKIVIETKSEIDILDDGYKWRKYGQKVVKGNPNPRNYYKCTNIGCPVRKLVERASHDLQSVITTYEAKHNHGVPVRGGGSYATTQPPKSNTAKISNNCMTETSTSLLDYSHSVLGMRRLTDDNDRICTSQKLEKSKDFDHMESSYPNQDWMREKFLLKTKEEPETDFIYNSF